MKISGDYSEGPRERCTKESSQKFFRTDTQSWKTSSLVNRLASSWRTRSPILGTWERSSGPRRRLEWVASSFPATAPPE